MQWSIPISHSRKAELVQAPEKNITLIKCNSASSSTRSSNSSRNSHNSSTSHSTSTCFRFLSFCNWIQSEVRIFFARGAKYDCAVYEMQKKRWRLLRRPKGRLEADGLKFGARMKKLAKVQGQLLRKTDLADKSNTFGTSGVSFGRDSNRGLRRSSPRLSEGQPVGSLFC